MFTKTAHPDYLHCGFGSGKYDTDPKQLKLMLSLIKNSKLRVGASDFFKASLIKLDHKKKFVTLINAKYLGLDVSYVVPSAQVSSCAKLSLALSIVLSEEYDRIALAEEREDYTTDESASKLLVSLAKSLSGHGDLDTVSQDAALFLTSLKDPVS